jgi:site-specific recombinase XerD
MYVEVYVRHSGKCPHKANRYYKKCRCRKWLAIAGQDKRLSAETRSWETAERKAREMSVSGETRATPSGEQTVKHATQAFIEDKAQQALSKNWQRKLTRELNDFAKWCDSQVALRLSDVTLHRLEEYRKTWTGSPLTRRKRQERLRSFFLYCLRHKWVTENSAAHLSTIKISQAPTLPLTREQFETVMKAAHKYNPKAADKDWRRQRALAMLLLLRWSGLRIGDAARLERASLSDRGTLRLYTQKTGESVYVPLPPSAVTSLRGVPNSNTRYFFWNGTSAVESPGKRWWSTLKRIFVSAGIPDAHPHMLRDTFAVEMLQAGVTLEQVSILLGHKSVKITEKHYTPWVRARQEQLEQSVQRAWHVGSASLGEPLRRSKAPKTRTAETNKQTRPKPGLVMG